MTDAKPNDTAGAAGAPPAAAGNTPPVAPPAKEEKAKAADRAPAPLTFRDAAYTGPMTGDQAAWRNANLKPASARTK